MMNTKYDPHRWILNLALIAGVVSWALPHRSAADEPTKKAEASEKKGDEKEEEEKPDFPPFDEVSEDHEKKAGFFDLYYNKKKDHLLAVIPKAMVGKNFLVASSIAGGSPYTGFTLFTEVVQWREMGKKLVLIEPDTSNARSEDATVSDVIARTYTDRIVLSTKIVSKRDGDPVIDLDDVFKKDRVGLSRFHKGSVNSGLSKWAKTKAFEKNIELAVDMALMSGSDGGRRTRVHYSISELPESDYEPRRADDRVGYFMTAIKNWGRDHTDKTVFDRYIHRWRLRKADPEAEVSDVHPDDQIVFYIEKTVPIKFRRYVRDGILEWNKAFERCGLLNAVAVRQQTDTNEWKDLDPEDVRYNFFRWIVSGRAFAMGPSRTNPLTGQILDADIVWDDALTRSLLSQYGRFGAKGTAAHDPQLQEFFANNPEWRFASQHEALLGDEVSYGGVDMSWSPEVMSMLSASNSAFCACADGMRHEMAMADFVLRSEGSDGLSDEFVGQFIKYVVAHEVGHTLGLRHNFKASAWKSIDALLSCSDANEPTSGSVMDYNAAVFAEKQEDQPRYVTPALGPYDYWAIEYGYRHTDDELKTEDDLLSAIASRGNGPGLAYATDEDTGFYSPDPSVNRWDNGSDPVEYAKARMAMVDRLRTDITDWAVEDGESYSRLRRVFDALLGEYGRSALFAARTIGGQYITRNHKGDADERPPFEIVPVKKQRDALAFLSERVFSDKAFQFDPELLNKLSPGRWRHWDSDDYDHPREYPVHDRIAAVQYWALFQVLNPFTISRIHDAELKVPANKDALTVPEVVSQTTQAIWSELDRKLGSTKWTNRKPFVSSIRRTLQRAHLRTLIQIVLSRPGSMVPADVHAVVRLTLESMSKRIGRMLADDKNTKLDVTTRAHFDEAKARIDRSLEAEFRL